MRTSIRIMASAAILVAWLSVVVVGSAWHLANASADHLACLPRSGSPGSLSLGGPSGGSWCSYPDGTSIQPERRRPFTVAAPTWSLLVAAFVVVAAAALGIRALRRVPRWTRPPRCSDGRGGELTDGANVI